MKTNDVFINCPYDKNYAPTLHAIMFTCISLDLNPILSVTDTLDSKRINNIRKCILKSIISIHDLSIMGTCENSRYNMPLEIGMAVMHHFQCEESNEKHNIIILEPQPYLTQKCCSDLNAFDPIVYNKENGFEDLINNLARSIVGMIGQENKLEPYEVFNEFLGFQTFMYNNNLWEKITLNALRDYMKKYVEHSKHYITDNKVDIILKKKLIKTYKSRR